MSGFWNATELVHRNNHIQYSKECNISTNHILNREIVDRLVFEPSERYQDLYPGVYVTEINGEDYYFDIPFYVNGTTDYLSIKNPFDTSLRISVQYYTCYLYKKAGSNNGQQVTLNSTVNDSLDMVIISGHTVMGIQSLNNPTDIRSISNIKLHSGYNSTTDMDSINEPLTINLKNNIKSLPNGVKDTFCLDSSTQRYHITFRIGRDIYSGNENWQYLRSYSNDDYKVFFTANKYAKFENSDNNINCSHLECMRASTVLNTMYPVIGIATSYLSTLGNGIIIKVPTSIFGVIDEDDVDSMWVRKINEFLFNEFTTSTPFIVEYALDTPIYKFELLDEYHIHTYYPHTNISLDGDYDISYFYKAIRLTGGE